MIIDVHTHIVPENFPAAGNRSAGHRWPFMDHTEPGKANVMFAGRNFRTVLDRCWSVPRRLREMAAADYAVGLTPRRAGGDELAKLSAIPGPWVTMQWPVASEK